MPVLRNWDLRPDADMVLRAQGADPLVVRQHRSAALETAEQAVAVGTPLLQSVVVSAAFRVREFRHEQLRLERGGYLGGPLIAEHFHAAQEVVVAVCTIGPGVEALASSCFAGDPAIAVALDAFGSAAVDLLASALCQLVGQQAAARGLQATVPLSPGLAGWPLATGQSQLFALVDGAEAAITLTESRMMVPQKSTSLAIGLGAGVQHSGQACDYCSMAKTCHYRQVH
jgi:hypothetical protein